MDNLAGTNLWSFLDGRADAQKATPGKVRKGRGYHVDSYLELASKVAELQFRNKDFVLLFRGQPTDHRTPRTGLSTLRPSIFRPLSGRELLPRTTLEKRLTRLRQAERLLIEKFTSLKRLGRQRVQRQRLLRWAILQHYEVCDTPLLDVSQSLRIAASFASEGTSEGFLYAFAIPNLSGTVTASAEAGIQIVRLSGVCPPSAIRPHIQEGFLLGEYPDFASIEQKDSYDLYELDFGRRLLAKFRFNPRSFWNSPEFPRVTHDALYPKSKDWLEASVAEIAAKLKS